MTIESELEKEQLELIKLEKKRLQNEISNQEEEKVEREKEIREYESKPNKIYELILHEPSHILIHVLRLVEVLHQRDSRN